jgi:hypothetical protein
MTWRSASWVAAVGLLLADLFLHKPITDICDAWVVRFGWATYNRWTFWILVSVSIAVALALLVRRWRGWLRPSAVAALLLLILATCVAYRFLIVANIELIHFPQYALMAGVLLAGGNPPGLAWAATVAAGVVDETYQHLVIYAGRPNTYLDFNDMVLNAIGASWLVLLVAAGTGSHTRTPQSARRAARRLVVVVAVAALALLWLDPPRFTPYLRRAATGRYYRVLSATEGVLAAALLWAVTRLGLGAASTAGSAASRAER